MTADTILIDVAPGETRIALLEDGRLEGIVIDRAGHESIVGNIYLGRVESVVDGLQAAFVDIGLGKSGFLALPEVRPPDADEKAGIGDFLNEGDSVVVQVLRDPIEDKGAKLTARIGISGRDLVFKPGQPGVSISRRIDDEGERQRLGDLMAEIADEGEGFILRTAAADAEAEDLRTEAERLRDRWHAVEDAGAGGRAPLRLLRDEEPAVAVLRDHGGADLDRVVVDDPDMLARLRAYAEREMPEISRHIESHTGRRALFDTHGVEEMIEEAFDCVVELPSGGSLIISEMPALTAIDVNTGGATDGGKEHTALVTNREAAVEIARQIRLRNLSGLMVADFAPLRRDDHRGAVLDALRRAMANDPLQPHVIGYTRLGLVEMTRRRRGPSLGEVLGGEPSAPVKSELSVALEALRAVLREAAAHPGSDLVIEAAPTVVEALQGEARRALAETETRLAVKIGVRGDADYGPEAFAVVPAGSGEMK